MLNTLNTTSFPGEGETLLYLVFQDEQQNDQMLQKLNELSGGALFRKMQLHEFSGKVGDVITVEPPSSFQHIIICGLGKKQELKKIIIKNTCADGVRIALAKKAKII